MKHVSILLTLLLIGCGSSSSTPATPGFVGEKIGTVPGPGGCGIKDAYKVTEAAGISLSQPAMINRRTAETLSNWLANHARPIIGNQGGGLVAIKVAAHYACRTRNHQKGARLSEHAKGNAIDISAFLLADGSSINVLNGWNGQNSGTLRRLHQSACGPFGTVLGPDADRFHKDHFHFDIADNGPYCR